MLMSDIALGTSDFVGGSGTELSSLLAAVGIRYTEGCTCRQKASMMDAMGIRWCEENLDHVILPWLRDEAVKRGLPYVGIAARALVLLAISRAKKSPHAKP